IDQLSEILGDSQWAERNYGNGNKAEHRCESGEVTFRFVVDQG
ncbi:4697_t:CDS:2, partial [Dentiscutata heterogama]